MTPLLRVRVWQQKKGAYFGSPEPLLNIYRPLLFFVHNPVFKPASPPATPPASPPATPPASQPCSSRHQLDMTPLLRVRPSRIIQ